MNMKRTASRFWLGLIVLVAVLVVAGVVGCATAIPENLLPRWTAPDHIVRGPMVLKEIILLQPVIRKVDAVCSRNKEGSHEAWSCYYEGEWYWLNKEGIGYRQWGQN